MRHIINSNLIRKSANRICIENGLVTEYFTTHIPNSKIYVSKVVGQIYLLNYIKEGVFYSISTPLCRIIMLGIEYTLLMEEDGILLKKYVNHGQVIDYNYPIFLISKNES